MKFFFDNSLSPNQASAIQALAKPDRHTVCHLRDLFPPNVSDTDWITSLAKEGKWIIISGDPRISRNRHERAAWRESGLTAFFLTKEWTKLGFSDQAWRLVRWWPRIVEQASLVRPGVGFEVPVNPTSQFKRLDFK